MLRLQTVVHREVAMQRKRVGLDLVTIDSARVPRGIRRHGHIPVRASTPLG